MKGGWVVNASAFSFVSLLLPCSFFLSSIAPRLFPSLFPPFAHYLAQDPSCRHIPLLFSLSRSSHSVASSRVLLDFSILRLLHITNLKRFWLFETPSKAGRMREGDEGNLTDVPIVSYSQPRLASPSYRPASILVVVRRLVAPLLITSLLALH